MALILHLETATPTCSAALSENGALLALKEETGSNIHANVITVFIETLMRDAGRRLTELDAVCVSKGPGSYTGLRIGVSTAKGLCYALDKPLIAAGTLEAMVHGILRDISPPEDTLLCPMLDARRMEVFMAVYPARTPNAPLAAARAQVMDAGSLNNWRTGNKLLLFGSGAGKCRELYREERDISIIDDFHPSAAHLISLAEKKYAAEQFEDLAYFEPFYLKEFYTPRA